jgi:hypothetical protein
MKNFLRDLFLLPGNNGERRLVRHIFTKKMVWTKGTEPQFVENPEVKKIMKKTDSEKNDTTSFIPFEPISKGRFVVDFPGIDSFLINSYKFLGEDKEKREWSDFKVTLLMTHSVDVNFYSKKKEKIGPINILVLDTIGSVVRTIELSDCCIEKVALFEDFDYSKEELQFMKIRVSHAPRKLS